MDPSEGGTGSPPTSTDVYNLSGQLVWSKDANGTISYTAYDGATGAVDKQIQDANVNGTATVGPTEYPSADWTLLTGQGWNTTSGIYKNLVTTYLVDSNGRTIEAIDPDQDVTCTVYNDYIQAGTDGGTILSQTLTYPGWNATAATTTGVVQVSQDVLSGSGVTRST